MDITRKRPSPESLSTRVGLRPAVVFVLASTCALVIATLIDRPLWEALRDIDPAVYTSSWFQALRSLGYLPVWLVASLAIFSVDRGVHSDFFPAASRALFLATSVLAAGGLSEVLKVLIRRVRPGAAGGEYVFRPFLEDPLSTSGLGMPSGHAMVAFAAAWVLCRLWPAASVVWIAGAVGCAATRLLSQAHFASDVVLSAVVSFAIVRYIWAFSRHLDTFARHHDHTNRRPPPDPDHP